jgi:hypothetical protein
VSGRARVGSFAQPTLTFAQPLSVIHPPDNNFEVVGNTQGTPPSPDQDFQKATSGSLENEIAALYQALREAQELNK